jgi:hypothetical protein
MRRMVVNPAPAVALARLVGPRLHPTQLSRSEADLPARKAGLQRPTYYGSGSRSISALPTRGDEVIE